MEGTTTPENTAAGNGLGAEVQRVIGNAEAMLREAATSGTEKAAELRDRALEQLRDLRETLEDAGSAMVERSKEAARVTDDYVHAHPWQAVGIGAAIGVLVGMLIARR